MSRLPLLLAVLAAAPAAGQAPSVPLGADSLAAPLLLRIDGSVSARTVLHRTAPSVEVRFWGDVVDTLSVDLRENLPRPVTPGTTYRDVRVSFEVRSALPAADAFLERILRPVPPAAVPPDGGAP